ncbi:MAG: hypothetical protein JWP31_1277 [Aeromicrobium sp.]|nr:hypothetical protein [Aeromicrobium sp.]
MVGRGGLSVTEELAARPQLGGLPVPFACEDDDGALDHSAVVKRRAIQCALSRICGICGETLARPIAFIGSREEGEANSFVFPPTHLPCAESALSLFAPIGGRHLGHPEPPLEWVLVTTGGFDLVRPSRRGDPVSFTPNSILTTRHLD